MDQVKTYGAGLGFSNTHFLIASSAALIGAFTSIIERRSRGRTGEYSTTGLFPWSFGDKSFFALHARSRQSRIAVGAFSTSLATFNSPVAIVRVLLVFTCNPSGNGASSSCGCWCCGGCAGCGTSGTGIDGFPSSGGAGASSSLKAVSTCPYPNPPDFISSRSLLDNSLNVQFFMAGMLLGTMRLKSTTRST
nr:hypothetical protein Itr_chr13CG12730 [Ipomoea trifida]